MLITKIKLKRQPWEVFISYTIPHPNSKTGLQDIDLSCKEEPRSQFPNKLDTLLPIVINAIGLDADAWEKGEVIGLSLKHCDDGIGVTITAKCQIGNLFACPTTPYISPDAMGNFENLDKQIMEVIQEAILYINGERMPLPLFDQSNQNSGGLTVLYQGKLGGG
ncbi:MAG TPA: hypothetical protein VK184_23515 [Nostocaceae cyanobacterium]|nr:hypothetical protein [Nostocaceae cyanobacterium]